MKNVYVILVKSLTRIGTFTRFFTRYPYSHASLSLDDDLEQFYSFSRYYYNSPIISGFTSEYRSHLAAKQNKVTECKIFKIPVTDEEYKIIKERIQKMIKDQELMYNYFSLLTMIFRRSVSVYKSYTCTSFVAETISLIDKIKLPKPASRFVPKDFEKLLNDEYAFFEGKLEPKKVFKKDHYYHKVPVAKRFSRSLYAISESFHRLLFGKPRKHFNHNKIYVNPKEID